MLLIGIYLNMTHLCSVVEIIYLLKVFHVPHPGLCLKKKHTKKRNSSNKIFRGFGLKIVALIYYYILRTQMNQILESLYHEAMYQR